MLSGERRSWRGEMIEAAAVGHRPAVGVEHFERGRAGADTADSRQRQPQLLSDTLQRRATRLRSSEKQLVIIASRQDTAFFQCRVFDVPESRRSRHLLVMDQPAHPGALQNVRQVARQPVRDLERRMRQLWQPLDVSDGLPGDLAHILERSREGGLVHYEQVPRAPAFRHVKDAALEKRCVLSGGDDYELLFTAPQACRAPLESVGKELRLPLSRIGSIRSGASPLEVLDADGRPMSYCGGFDHFAAP